MTIATSSHDIKEFKIKGMNMNMFKVYESLLSLKRDKDFDYDTEIPHHTYAHARDLCEIKLTFEECQIVAARAIEYRKNFD